MKLYFNNSIRATDPLFYKEVKGIRTRISKHYYYLLKNSNRYKQNNYLSEEIKEEKTKARSTKATKKTELTKITKTKDNFLTKQINKIKCIVKKILNFFIINRSLRKS